METNQLRGGGSTGQPPAPTPPPAPVPADRVTFGVLVSGGAGGGARCHSEARGKLLDRVKRILEGEVASRDSLRAQTGVQTGIQHRLLTSG